MMASRILQLSTIIAENTTKLNQYFTSHNLPMPSLDASASATLPIPENESEIQLARTALIEACTELKALASGPEELLTINWSEHVSLRVILRFKLDKAFPIGGLASFEDLSQASGLNVHDVRRIIRHGIYNHFLFQEPSPGVVTHSALTKALAENEKLRDAVITRLEEFVPASIKTADAMEKWPCSEENNETGFSLANNSKSSMWEIFSANPDRGARFGNLMASSSSKKEYDTQLLLENFPWRETMTMVDVGGSHGHVAIAVSKRFPHLKCTVQDLPEVVKQGEAKLPKQLNDQITFIPHNFFDMQTVSADVYYFRWIFHNWSDKYCIRILKNLIPALRPNAQILIHDRVTPTDLSTLSLPDARNIVNMDIGMLQLLNARQRTLADWKDLFIRADTRYTFRRAFRPEGGQLSIIIASWRD